MISLKFYQAEDFKELNYQLSDLQMEYTASVDLALQRISEREKNGDFFAKPISIFEEKKAVGFFVLDFGKDKLELSENPDCILVRSFSINPKFQGLGYGKTAMNFVYDFIKNNYPEVSEVVLSVNEKNDLAYQIYLKTGYHFYGKTREGRSGLQRILTKKI
jgi:ribosomal protein S18 acetylase RimI-like enzyme